MTTIPEKVHFRPHDIEALASPAASDTRRFSRDASGEFLKEKTTAAAKPDRGQHLAPSERFTGHQLFYIFGLDGVGGMAISAGVNFAIAYVMYTTQNTEKSPIRLFQLPNTIAGDAAITIIVQCILTWFVEWGLVAHDLGNRSVQPIGFIHQPSHPLLRWWFFLDGNKPKPGLMNVLQQALRGFLLCVPAFMLLWPVSVGALTAVGQKTGGDWGYEDRWVPQFFKFILGGLLGLLTTPLMAMFWLVKAGWEAQEGQATDEEDWQTSPGTELDGRYPNIDMTHDSRKT